jgi:hypothetical protein
MVEQIDPGKVFLTFNSWDYWNKTVLDLCNGEGKGRPHERGSKKANILKNCREDNIAVNAKFFNVRRNNDFAVKLIDLSQCLRKLHPDCNVELRNYVHYRSGDFMGWHTNKYQAGHRYYLIWAEEEGKSFFEYEKDGKIISLPDKKGWSVNKFFCGDDDKLFPHQVVSNTNRVCIGFKLK